MLNPKPCGFGFFFAFQQNLKSYKHVILKSPHGCFFKITLFSPYGKFQKYQPNQSRKNDDHQP